MSKLQKTDCTRLKTGLQVPAARPLCAGNTAGEKSARRRYTVAMKLLRPLICTAVCLYALAASAQWQWLDKDGRRVFSDRAPPSDIPEKNVLKRPGGRGPAAVAAPAIGVTADAPTAPIGLDKALQDKKKQAEEVEAAKRKAEEDRNARQMAESCSRAQQAKAGFDSGGRISRINEKGEREFLDEAALAAEAQRLQNSINENCK